MSPRTLAGAVVLVLGAAALWAVFAGGPKADASPPRAFTSSEQCRECHADAYAEWADSWHSRAWSDPEVRALSNDFANADCIDCHASQPVFETGVGRRVLPRASRRGEGVDCISCHLLPAGHASSGTVAGTRDDPNAACEPTAVRDLGSSDFCAVCHDQHDTTKQWRATDYAAKGIGCIDCHMPPRVGGKRGRDHRMLGGHDLELVRSAVTLRGKREGAQWVVEVENTGAGHHFPTEERSRAADVFWRPLGATGVESWRHAYRFRTPYRHENLPDTLLPAHATQAIPIESDGAIEVVLFFALRPYWADAARPDPEREARVVHRLELRP